MIPLFNLITKNFTERAFKTIAFSSFSKLQSDILIPLSLFAFFIISPKASAAVFFITNNNNYMR